MKYIKFKTIKKCIKHIEVELPKLFGFSQANLIMHNDRNNQLYSIGVDEDADMIYAKEGPPGFEREFYVPED